MTALAPLVTARAPSQQAGGAAGECDLQDGIVASTMLVGDLADIMTVRLEHAVSCCPESSSMQTM